MARMRCQVCKARFGSTRLEQNGGKCPKCGDNLAATRWRHELRYEMKPNLSFEEVDKIIELALVNQVHPFMIIKSAVASKLFEYDANPGQFKRDQMLVKLARP